MADPATLALIAAGVSAATTITGGVAAMGAAQANERVAKNNARLARQQAESQAAQNARETRLAISRRMAAAGSRGVQFSGTMLDVAAEEALAGELETRFIAHAGDVEAKRNILAARQQRMQGRIALGTSFAQAGGTLLSGFSRFGEARAAGSGAGATGTTSWSTRAMSAGVS